MQLRAGARQGTVFLFGGSSQTSKRVYSLHESGEVDNFQKGFAGRDLFFAADVCDGAALYLPTGAMRQTVPLPSSHTSRAPSCATVTPTGRPQTLL